MKPADRLGELRPYFFAQLGKKINGMRARGVDVIRLDMGSPDLPPPDPVIEALAAAARVPANHGYTLGSGTAGFRQAVAEYYERRFGVDLDPGYEVIDLIGSKEGLFILSMAYLNPGDVSLVPDPGYAVYAKGAEIAGAQPHRMPLTADNAFLPDLGAIPADVLKRAKVLWLNYPNNPTGAIVDLDYFKSVIAFAKKHSLVVAHDAPYTDVGFDGYRAPSLMQVPGAKEVAVEFNSFSKAFNMAGWRLGMVVGQPDILKYIETYKSQQDSAIFAPIMAAGEAAMQTDQSWINARNQVYQRRRDIVLDGLHSAGLRVQPPQASLYIWVPLPEGTRSKEFCARMLDDVSVSTTPGAVFGQHGEGYLRISLVTDDERIKEGTARMVEWLRERV